MTLPRALVVDDSLTVRMDLVEALGEAGFDAMGAPSLAEARAALAAGRFDVVVLDVRLGDGDGVDLLCEIRQGEAEGTHTPVMMLSSEADVSDRIRGLATGADEYVGKPYVLSYVVGRARELVDASRSSAPRGERPVVLVIDDSISFREAMRDALEAAGYAAVTAASGEEGLQRAAALRPQLVIVDGQLPGIDGATVIRRLRLDAPLRHTPCIMITASDVADAEMTAFEAGVDTFLHKRTPPAEIVARVGSLITRAPAVASVRSSLSANKVLAVGAAARQLAGALRREAFDVAFASTAADALLLLEVEKPACVLVDASEQPDGCATLCEALARSTAAVALVPDGDAQLVIACLAAGADEVVATNTPAPALVARIRAQLRRKQADEEAARERDAVVARELAIAEARAAERLAEARAELLAEIERKNAELAAANAELEAFSYSVSHDLRAPLRAIEGFSRALEEDQGHLLEEVGRQHLARVFGATARMRDLIDDLLALSRVTRAELRREDVDLSALARVVAADLRARAPGRPADIDIQDGLRANGDAGLLRAALENLLGNAWKFSSKRERTSIAVGATTASGARAFYVRDNGVGFDMARADKLFRPFQRLHSTAEFEGTGVGLATVRRIITRHGGRIWAESSSDGTCFYFTLA